MSVGFEKANFGRDWSRTERHRDAFSVRQRSGGDHGEAERALSRPKTALGAGAALSVRTGPGWSSNWGHLQVRHRNKESTSYIANYDTRAILSFHAAAVIRVAFLYIFIQTLICLFDILQNKIIRHIFRKGVPDLFWFLWENLIHIVIPSLVVFLWQPSLSLIDVSILLDGLCILLPIVSPGCILLLKTACCSGFISYE